MSEVQKLMLDVLGEGVSRPVVRLTLRLPHEEHQKLLILSEVTKSTKTALGEKLLRAAVSEAFSVYLDTLHEIAASEVVRELDQSLEYIYAIEEHTGDKAEVAA